MLSPALNRLFAEINEVDASARSKFEADLHRELTAVSSAFEWLLQSEDSRFAVTPRVKAALTSALSVAKTLLGVDVGVNREDGDAKSIGVAIGSYPISVSMRCSKIDCPNKRIK